MEELLLPNGDEEGVDTVTRAPDVVVVVLPVLFELPPELPVDVDCKGLDKIPPFDCPTPTPPIVVLLLLLLLFSRLLILEGGLPPDPERLGLLELFFNHSSGVIRSF